MVEKLIMTCMHARTTAHIMHLQTTSYAQHKALADFYEGIVELIDGFAEAYQGEYGLIKNYPSGYKPPATALDLMDDVRECIDECAAEIDAENTHLQNILDELRALVAQTAYKLRFLK